MIRPALRLAAVAICALALSGCISLLPKTKPAQLYRFGQPGAASALAGATASTAPASVGVFRANGVFQSAAAGDRILTFTGGKAAYIAQARWVAPAAVLFDEAVLAAFDADTGPVRLISRGEQGKADYALRLDVRNFEARYDRGRESAPTVVVRVRAALTKSDQTQVGEQIFEAHVDASDNRIGAIVVAYDKAIAEVLGKIVAWITSSLG